MKSAQNFTFSQKMKSSVNFFLVLHGNINTSVQIHLTPYIFYPIFPCAPFYSIIDGPLYLNVNVPPDENPNICLSFIAHMWEIGSLG